MIKAKVFKCDNFISQKGTACTWLTCIFGDDEICKVFIPGTVEFAKGVEVSFKIVAGPNLNPQLKLIKS